MNIFQNLKTYAGKWSVSNSRNFSDEEQQAVQSAEVVASKEGYGNSVCFFMKSGFKQFIPLSVNSGLSVGDLVDLSTARLLTLSRVGEADIYRVEA